MDWRLNTSNMELISNSTNSLVGCIFRSPCIRTGCQYNRKQILLDWHSYARSHHHLLTFVQAAVMKLCKNVKFAYNIPKVPSLFVDTIISFTDEKTTSGPNATIHLEVARKTRGQKGPCETSRFSHLKITLFVSFHEGPNQLTPLLATFCHVRCW